MQKPSRLNLLFGFSLSGFFRFSCSSFVPPLLRRPIQFSNSPTSCSRLRVRLSHEISLLKAIVKRGTMFNVPFLAKEASETETKIRIRFIHEPIAINCEIRIKRDTFFQISIITVICYRCNFIKRNFVSDVHVTEEAQL